MGTWVLAAGDEFVPPGVQDFNLPPIFAGITKPMALVFLSVLIVAGFFLLTMRKAQVVPGKFQFLGESIYNVPRNQVARAQIGAADFRRFVPLIVALFMFILVNNIYGIIPVLQYPTMANIGFPLALSVLVVYPVYHYAGIRKFGLAGYLKNQLLPPGVPWPVYILLAPIELIFKFLVNPLTLAIRVFAAMFAGHMLILVFALAGEHLLIHGQGLLKAVAALSFLTVIAITFLEALIMTIQAYIFATLSANYIGTALAEAH